MHFKSEAAKHTEHLFTPVRQVTCTDNKPKKCLNLQGMLLQIQVAGVGSVMQQLVSLRREAALRLAVQLAQGCDEVTLHCITHAVAVQYACQLVNDGVQRNVSKAAILAEHPADHLQPASIV